MGLPRRLIRSKSFWIALGLISLVVLRPTYAFRNGQFASLVLGQPGFFSAAAPTQVSAATLHRPAAVAVDPSTGKVFVADSGNNRVLRFAALEQLRNGAEAEGVLGQPDFSTNVLTTTQSGMATPSGLAVDTSGHLWVADTFNHRVLRFDSAADKPNGAPADGVLGQPDFSTNVLTTTQSSLIRPQGLALDGTGRLWVADRNQSRILRFDSAASKPNFPGADLVIGQPSMTSADNGVSTHGLTLPSGAAVDGAGRLWVADTEDNRVLMFDPAGGPPTPEPVYLPQVQQLQWVPTRTPTPTPVPPQCLLGSGDPESCLQGQPAAATPTPTREPRPRTP